MDFKGNLQDAMFFFTNHYNYRLSGFDVPTKTNEMLKLKLSLSQQLWPNKQL